MMKKNTVPGLLADKSIYSIYTSVEPWLVSVPPGGAAVHTHFQSIMC